MIVGVPRESFPGERRVALTPSAIPALKKLSLDLLVESGAGLQAGFPDSAYVTAGARIAPSRQELFQQSDIIAQVRAAGANSASSADLNSHRSGHILIAQCDALTAAEQFKPLAEKGVCTFALELMPRTTKAQVTDVLSSMQTIAGYRAVLLAALELPQMFPLLMTAAGTLSPARAFVIGAGVAGLQAIATAKRLGAIVQAYDVRPAVKEQVESVGGKFVQLDIGTAEGTGGYAKQMDEEFYRKQRELMGKIVAASDVVITTAAIPGKKSPILITADHVRLMPPGSVIIDLAAERGGNCELTQSGQRVVHNGVTILGPLNIASDVPRHASQMFSNNLCAFLGMLIKKGAIQIDRTDEIIAGTLVTQGGNIVNQQIRSLLGITDTSHPPVPPPLPSSPPSTNGNSIGLLPLESGNPSATRNP